MEEKKKVSLELQKDKKKQPSEQTPLIQTIKQPQTEDSKKAEDSQQQKKHSYNELQSMIMEKLEDLESLNKQEQQKKERELASDDFVLQIETELTKIIKNTGQLSHQERFDKVGALYKEKVAVEYKEMMTKHVKQFVDQQRKQIALQQATEKQKHNSAILGKYEIIARNVNSNYSDFQSEHKSIMSKETEKRAMIEQQFQSHFDNLYSQIEAEKDSNKKTEQSLIDENSSLEQKYQELMKEIGEKSVLMDEQMKNKQANSDTIEEQMNQSIDKQEKEIKEQIALFDEHTAKKEEEAKTLKTLLTDYISKFKEFEQERKNKHSAIKTLSNNLKTLDNQISEKKDLKRQLLGMPAVTGDNSNQGESKSKKKKNKKKKNQQEAETTEESKQENTQTEAGEVKKDPIMDAEYEYDAIIKERDTQWQGEKTALLEEIEKLKAECKDLQSAIQK